MKHELILMHDDIYPVMHVDLIGEEDAVGVVVVGRVDPGVADEVDGGVVVAGDVFESESFEEELTVMGVLDAECSWDSDLFFPLEFHVVN